MAVLFINPMAWDLAGWAQKIRDAKDFVAELIALFAILANFLPRAERMAETKWKVFYQKVCVPAVAFLACNWRKHLPGLDWTLLQKKEVNHDDRP